MGHQEQLDTIRSLKIKAQWEKGKKYLSKSDTDTDLKSIKILPVKVIIKSQKL